MREWIRQSATVALVSAVVLFTNLGGPRLWDRDEPRNAGCAQEMLARGDWVTPVFNGELRSHKPVLLYWLMMSAYGMFGVGEFAARFWSATLGVGTAWCTYAMGRRLFNGSAGIWAGIAIASSLMFGVAGRAATPDSLLIFLSTLAVTIYVYGTFPSAAVDADGAGTSRAPAPAQFFPRWGTAAAMYGVMGLAMLAKGPVGLVMPTAVIGMFLLIIRLPVTDPQATARSGGWTVWLRVLDPRHFLRTCWSMRPLTALAVSLAVAAPWYVWVGLRTDGEFLRGFFLEHNLGRAMRPMEGHNGGILFYPCAILIGFFPWSVFALPAMIDLLGRCRQGDRWRSGYLLATCWVMVYVLLFSLARTKLPSYVTPSFPALALITGCFVHHWTQGTLLGAPLWRRLAFTTLALVGLLLLLALPIAAHRLLPGEEWLAVVGLIPLLGGATAWLLMEQDRVSLAAATFAASSVVLTTVTFGLVAHRVSRHQQNHHLLAEIDKRSNAAHVASFGLLEPTWIFYGKRPVHELPANGKTEWLGTWVELNGRWQRKPSFGVSEVVTADDEWFIITTDEHYPRLRPLLPSQFQVLQDTPYFLRGRRLLLVGRGAPFEERRLGREGASAARLR